MKKTLVFAVIFAGWLSAVNAQIVTDKQKKTMDDMLREMETGKLTLYFTDALTGRGIKGVKVALGEMDKYITDFEGKILFELIEPNAVIIVKAEHEKYIAAEFEIEAEAGTIRGNQFSLSPKMPVGAVRIVLDWGKSPADLDLHLEKVSDYHISYRNKRVSADGIANLDRDDTDGQGPETITVKRVDNGAIYKCFVHDYSNKSNKQSRALSDSEGNVKVYGGNNELLHVIRITPDMSGVNWHLFDIRNGMIELKNNVEEW
ncbi:MAG: hypothetical protein K9I69_07155 [Ignavibacteriales bacterium]|nr:hypothetical protein [Ignavibacteriales bacterium]MCF8315179.1 hypothetical protein [Ignavibacteriales bacterium]MCF8435825.1 hypothetical protein [Ignavibacteriales bacterium]